MDFFDRAWNSAAEQYGRDRSEKYGRFARAWRLIQLAAIVALVVGISLAASGGLGG